MDKIVDDLAYTIGVERTALNVVGLDDDSRQIIAHFLIFISQEAAGKGLVTGSFILRRDSQVVLDAQSSTQVRCCNTLLAMTTRPLI